jgi:hypothetical protein
MRSSIHARRTIDKYNALLIHEAFHQYQYTFEEQTRKQAFKILMQEMWDNLRGDNTVNYILGNGQPDPMHNNFIFANGNPGPYNSYIYENYADRLVVDPKGIRHLQEIKAYEGQAQFIEDFTRRYLNIGPVYSRRQTHLNMNFIDYYRIMSNPLSGIRSYARP